MPGGSSAPKYAQIVQQLSRDLMSGRYRPGQKFPSEAALVRRFGASRITIGRVMRELQQRGFIDRVAGSGTYVRDGARGARGLTLGLVIPDLGETEIFEPICHGIAGAPEAADHALLWPRADPRLGGPEQRAIGLCEQCVERRVSGVFFAPLEMSDGAATANRRILKMLREESIPVVLLDRRAEETAAGERCDLAGLDNHHAGYVATRHLLGLGARRIGFVAYRGQASTVARRIAGYRDAMAEFEGGHESHAYYASPADTAVLPPESDACDAFLCANDRIAARVMRSLLARGIAIPETTRLVGIDDASYAALLPIPLTTVRQPCNRIGEAALRLMLERIERPDLPARHLLLDGELVIRESCGAIPGTTV